MKTTTQLSVFVENKAGTLLQSLDILKKSGISLIASSIADTIEYGICRIICTEPNRAYKELKKAGIAVALSDVFAIEFDNKVGSGAEAIRILSENGINITYLYSFLINGKGILIFRTNNPQKASESLLQANMVLLGDDELKELVKN